MGMKDNLIKLKKYLWQYKSLNNYICNLICLY
jgi:hypothetical protein